MCSFTSKFMYLVSSVMTAVVPSCCKQFTRWFRNVCISLSVWAKHLTINMKTKLTINFLATAKNDKIKLMGEFSLPSLESTGYKFLSGVNLDGNSTHSKVSNFQISFQISVACIPAIMTGFLFSNATNNFFRIFSIHMLWFTGIFF